MNFIDELCSTACDDASANRAIVLLCSRREMPVRTPGEHFTTLKKNALRSVRWNDWRKPTTEQFVQHAPNLQCVASVSVPVHQAWFYSCRTVFRFCLQSQYISATPYIFLPISLISFRTVGCGFQAVLYCIDGAIVTRSKYTVSCDSPCNRMVTTLSVGV